MLVHVAVMSLKSFRCRVLDSKGNQLSVQLVITAPHREAVEKILEDMSDETPGGIIREIVLAVLPDAARVEIFTEEPANVFHDVVIPWSFLSLAN